MALLNIHALNLIPIMIFVCSVVVVSQGDFLPISGILLQSLNRSDNSATLFSTSIDLDNVGGMYECFGFNVFTNTSVSANINILGQFSNSHHCN